jgi:hypothetical protein
VVLPWLHVDFSCGKFDGESVVVKKGRESAVKKSIRCLAMLLMPCYQHQMKTLMKWIFSPPVESHFLSHVCPTLPRNPQNEARMIEENTMNCETLYSGHLSYLLLASFFSVDRSLAKWGD